LLVDLLTRYSNRPDLCDDLQRLAEELRVEVARETAGAERVSVRSVQPEPKVRRVADRLSDEDIRAIVARFEQGSPKHILADEYGISLSSMKNLLKKNQAHQPWQVSDRLNLKEIEALLKASHEGTPQQKLGLPLDGLTPCL
jgi:hypothetical protein